MSLHSTEMGDHLEIIIFSSILMILLNSLISLTELFKTPIGHKELTQKSDLPSKRSWPQPKYIFGIIQSFQIWMLFKMTFPH